MILHKSAKAIRKLIVPNLNLCLTGAVCLACDLFYPTSFGLLPVDHTLSRHGTALQKLPHEREGEIRSGTFTKIHKIMVHLIKLVGEKKSHTLHRI